MQPDPNSYVAVQAAALREAARTAVATGDMRPVHRLVDHMTAEGPTGVTRDWLLAVALFKLSLEAQRQGRPELAAQYDEMALAECGTEAVHLVVLTALLDAGRQRGWLYADEYDRAGEIAEARFPELLDTLRQVPRRER